MITYYDKTQENKNLKMKWQLIDINPKMNQILELSKEFKRLSQQTSTNSSEPTGKQKDLSGRNYQRTK